MSVLDDKVREFYEAQQASTAQCQHFYYKPTGQENQQGFDSANSQVESRPVILNQLLELIGFDSASSLDHAIRDGISQYQYCHGGDLPHASVIAAALTAGHEIAKNVAKLPTAALNQISAQFDDISNMHNESVSVVPAMTVATVNTMIAYASPIVAMIPNSNNSNEVPIVSIRFVTDKSFGALEKGTYIDGVGASLPYAEGRFRFALNNGGAGTTYSVTATTQYESFKDKTPKDSAPRLPMVAGNISVRVNGKEIAHTRSRSKSKLNGTIQAIAEKSVLVGGVEIKATNASINLDTSKISVTLNQALPAGAKLEVYLVADYDTLDSNDHHILTPPGVSLVPEYETMVSAPVMMQITASELMQAQVSNELNIGFVGIALSIMQGKLYLEQTRRLLEEGKDTALDNGREATFDASRGASGNMAAAYNSTSDLFGEVMKYISFAKTQIIQDAGGVTTSWDLYVGDVGQTFFSMLSSDKMQKTGAIAGHNQIVRIGTLNDGTNVYHVPTSAGILAESATAFDMELIGRGNEPVRCPFIGFVAVPLTVKQASPDARLAKFTAIGSQAAEQNPIDRYADQVAVIHCVNMPSLKQK